MTPNQQTLRSVALSTRFNVAAFGVLGYELDLGELTAEECKQIAAQIAFYKKHRSLFQYGRLCRYFPREDRESWQITKEGITAAAIYNLTYQAVPQRDSLKILSAEPGRNYTMTSVPQQLKISRFGGLIKHILPVRLNTNGFILRNADRHFSMKDGKESYTASGAMLAEGINLAMQYEGSGYDPELRILGDFGSNLYLIREKENG
jgi:alpha-galactosidase